MNDSDVQSYTVHFQVFSLHKFTIGHLANYISNEPLDFFWKGVERFGNLSEAFGDSDNHLHLYDIETLSYKLARQCLSGVDLWYRNIAARRCQRTLECCQLVAPKLLGLFKCHKIVVARIVQMSRKCQQIWRFICQMYMWNKSKKSNFVTDINLESFWKS